MSSEMELAELQETLYSSRNPTRRWLHCSRRDWIVDALRHEAAAGVATECAIEVGPGSGIYLPILAELYKRVIGTDIEQQYLQASHRLLYRHPTVELLIDDITSSRLNFTPYASIFQSKWSAFMYNVRKNFGKFLSRVTLAGIPVCSSKELV
jgi:hypothetical protein